MERKNVHFPENSFSDAFNELINAIDKIRLPQNYSKPLSEILHYDTKEKLALLYRNMFIGKHPKSAVLTILTHCL